jgi:hypothetical protein
VPFRHPTKLALTQAESNYWKANIAFKIQEHFTASYQQYTTEQFISFLMGINIGLLSLTFIKTIAHITFRTIYAMKIGNRDVKKRICLQLAKSHNIVLRLFGIGIVNTILVMVHIIWLPPILNSLHDCVHDCVET